MVFPDYHIEATRAVFNQALREAGHMRLVSRLRGDWGTKLIALLTT